MLLVDIGRVFSCDIWNICVELSILDFFFWLVVGIKGNCDSLLVFLCCFVF